MASSGIPFSQINLQHSKSSSAVLARSMAQLHTGICLIQEPWLRGGNIKGLSGVGLSRIEAQLERGNYAVAVFMDVEGAFSHTSPHIICKEAASRGVPRPIVDWMLDLLVRGG